MSGLAAILGAVGGYASTTAAKQQSEYKDAKLKAIMSGGEMPEAPKSLGSQLVGKIKEALPTFGYDGAKSSDEAAKPSSLTKATETATAIKTQPVATAAVQPVVAQKTTDEEYGEAFKDESIVSDKPETYQNIYGQGRV
jgi:hypothetical protein